jgi:hypothetical protein
MSSINRNPMASKSTSISRRILRVISCALLALQSEAVVSGSLPDTSIASGNGTSAFVAWAQLARRWGGPQCHSPKYSRRTAGLIK